MASLIVGRPEGRLQLSRRPRRPSTRGLRHQPCRALEKVFFVEVLRFRPDWFGRVSGRFGFRVSGRLGLRLEGLGFSLGSGLRVWGLGIESLKVHY